MKPINPCPNCGSTDWQRMPELTGLLTGHLKEDGTRHVNLTQFALARIHCCKKCGFLELFSEAFRTE